MKKFCLFLTLAILSSEALGLSLRPKRQSEDNGDNEDNLEDRYGWNRPYPERPGRFPQRPWRPNPGQNQNQFPGQNQNQFPGQNQNQFPGQNQNQFPGQNQNQFPGQNQNQFPGQNQNQFPGQNQNQFPGQNQNQFPGQNQNQFPGQNQNQFPDQNQNQNQGQTTQAPVPSPNSASTQSPAVRTCLSTCPVTSEYNPVCGTNNVTYDNPSRLFCAQSCGVNVSQLRASRCPAAPAN